MDETSLSAYLSEISKYGLLTKDQEIEYATNLAEATKKFIDLLLDSPYVWEDLISRWRSVKDGGKVSNKLSERYGSGNSSSKELTKQVDKYILSAISLIERRSKPTYIKRAFKNAELSNKIYFSVYSSLPEEHKTKNLLDIYDEIYKYKNILINSNLRLVIVFAKKFQGMGIALYDLIQEGNIGLIRAVEKYDPTTNYKFSTYAVWWIKQALIRSIKNNSKTIRLPAHIHDIVIKMDELRTELRHNLKREPTSEEIGKEVGLKPIVVERLLKVLEDTISLEVPISGNKQDNKFLLKDFIPAPLSDPSDSIDQRKLEIMLMDLIEKTLNENERTVITLRNGLGNNEVHSLEDIGKKFGKSRERIRQVEALAIEKLRQNSQSLKGALEP